MQTAGAIVKTQQPFIQSDGVLGYHLCSTSDGEIQKWSSEIVYTKICITAPKGMHGALLRGKDVGDKSGLFVDFATSPSTIKGTIPVLVVNRSDTDFVYHKNDGIAKLVWVHQIPEGSMEDQPGGSSSCQANN